MARIRILAINNENNLINLLTSIVDFDISEKEEDFVLIKTFADAKLELFEGFFENENLQLLKSKIINNNQIEINEKTIIYDVNKNKRCSFLSSKNELFASNEKLISSPFEKCSCLIENWCENDKVKNLWISLSTEVKQDISKCLDINLYELIDRVGNVLHFKELNEINISLIHQNDKFITFSASMKNKFVPNKYFATIQIKSYDDIILKKGFFINERFIDFEIEDEDYGIDVEVYNIENNECVFKETFYFMKELCLNLSIIGPKICFKDNNGTEVHSIQTYSTDKTSTIRKTEKSKPIQYEMLRKKWTDNLLRKEQHFYRGFSEVEYKEAIKYFQYLLKQLSNCKKEYIYIADPYFFENEFNIQRFINYMDIFTAVQDKELRILTCSKTLPKLLKNFKRSNKYNLFKNIRIKSIIDINKKTNNSFHDRWIASDNLEYGLTNSLNNFKKGVSFFKSIEHYYCQSEILWNISQENPNYKIEELLLYNAR